MNVCPHTVTNRHISVTTQHPEAEMELHVLVCVGREGGG